MVNKKNNKRAMKLLGTTNIFKTFLTHVRWVLNPSLAVKLASEIYENTNKDKNIEPNIIAIGYLNEFFSKYIESGKTHEDIIKLNGQIDRQQKTSNKIANALIELREIRQKIKIKSKKNSDQVILTKTGLGVSQGVAVGKALNFKGTKQKVPNNCIGIFPTSGVKYTTQFLKCVGIIFKNGSITSHGAILARESKIPAIVFPYVDIIDNEAIEIDGIAGTVKRVVDSGN
ncbi:MAG: PEP-utilizing enzyme [Microgenomates group bacterium]